MSVLPAFADQTKCMPAERMWAIAVQPDGRLHVRDGHAAVGAVDDHRETVADADLGGDVLELDRRPHRRQVRRHRDEDPVGDREDREVDLAVGRVQVDDDRVDAVARLHDRVGDARRA